MGFEPASVTIYGVTVSEIVEPSLPRSGSLPDIVLQLPSSPTANHSESTHTPLSYVRMFHIMSYKLVFALLYMLLQEITEMVL